MDRRSFLRGAATVPLVGAAAFVSSEGPAPIEISSSSYRTNPDHRQIGDLLLAAAGVDAADVTYAVVGPDTATLTVLRRNLEGESYVHNDQMAVRQLVVDTAPAIASLAAFKQSIST